MSGTQPPGVLDTALSLLNGARDLVGADPATLDPISRLGRAGLRQFCRGRTAPSFAAGTTAFGLIGSDYVCEPLYLEPGNTPGEPPPPPPFNGGQCAGPYTACLALQSDQGRIPASGFTCAAGTGPFRIEEAIVFGNTWRVRLIGGNNAIAVQLSLPSSHTNRRYFVQFTRPGGVPDDCGDPPVPPYTPPTVADPYTWGDVENVDGVPVSTDEPATGTPVVNINIGGQALQVDLSGGGAAPLPPEFGDSDGSPNGLPAPQGGGDVPFGDPPEGSEWVGARWVLSGIPPSAGRWSGNPGNPNYLEINGIVRLSLVSSDGAASWLGTGQEMRSATGEIIRPIPALSVTGVQVFARYQGSLTIYPIAARLAA